MLNIPLHELDLTDGKGGVKLRPILLGKVYNIRDSIKDVGLLSPILVRRHKDKWLLIAGQHRVEPVRMLGWETIPAMEVFYNFEGEKAEDLYTLAEIDENLSRHELDLAMRAKFTKLRKVVYDRLHPEATARAQRQKAGPNGGRPGKNGAKTGSQKMASGSEAETPAESKERAQAFYKETASKTGRSESAVKIDQRRGETPHIEMLAGKKVNGEVLDSAADIYQDAKKAALPEAMAEAEQKIPDKDKAKKEAERVAGEKAGKVVKPFIEAAATGDSAPIVEKAAEVKADAAEVKAAEAAEAAEKAARKAAEAEATAAAEANAKKKAEAEAAAKKQAEAAEKAKAEAAAAAEKAAKAKVKAAEAKKPAIKKGPPIGVEPCTEENVKFNKALRDLYNKLRNATESVGKLTTLEAANKALEHVVQIQILIARNA